MTSCREHAGCCPWSLGFTRCWFFIGSVEIQFFCLKKTVYCSDGEHLWRTQETEFVITCVLRISLDSSHYIFIAQYLCTWARMTLSRHCLLKKIYYCDCVVIPCQYSCVLLQQFLLFFAFLFSKCLDSQNFRKQQANKLCLQVRQNPECSHSLNENACSSKWGEDYWGFPSCSSGPEWDFRQLPPRQGELFFSSLPL